MQPLYYTSSQNRYPMFYNALFELDQMGLTAQWYAENYATNLRTIQLEIDMGMYPSFEIRPAMENEHPLMPVAELFREMMLKPPYHPQLRGIPCEWPKNFVSFILNSNDYHLKKAYRPSAIEFAASRKEDLYHYYLNGCTAQLGKLDDITPEQLDLLISTNPMAVHNIDINLMEPRHWDLALNRNVNILGSTDISLYSKSAIKLICKTEPRVFRIVTAEKGLSLLDLKLDHLELLEAALTQDFTVSNHEDIFSIDEMIMINSSNTDGRAPVELISKYPEHAAKILDAFKYDHIKTHEILKHVPTEVILDLLHNGKLAVNQIPKVIHSSFEKLDEALSKQVRNHGRDDNAFDIPF